MRFLTADEIIYINEQIPSSGQIHQILQGRQRVRDMGLLELAVFRPMQTVFGQDAYPTVPEKAAALLHSLARNHPFADGNKRTATIAALFLLRINGLRVDWQPEQALAQIVAVAEGQLESEEFARWLTTVPCPPLPQPDAVRDMEAIHTIMREHDWLLSELAKR